MVVNPMDYSGKDTVLDVVRAERAKFYSIVDDPNNWTMQTRCTDWQVRDMVGHMIDVTEGYLSRWDMARKGEPADALGLQVMGERLNQNAQAFRGLPRRRGPNSPQFPRGLKPAPRADSRACLPTTRVRSPWTRAAATSESDGIYVAAEGPAGPAASSITACPPRPRAAGEVDATSETRTTRDPRRSRAQGT